MYLHATGTIPDPDKLAPYWPEETRVLAELHAEGVLTVRTGRGSAPQADRLHRRGRRLVSADR
jgi:hypothetical protein